MPEASKGPKIPPDGSCGEERNLFPEFGSVPGTSSVATLVSGGLDSAVLAVELCRTYENVFPVYVRCGLIWEAAELVHLKKFLAACARPELRGLKLVELPLADVYRAGHWSLSGCGFPDARSPDSAVFLPGRNLFLITKVAVWCCLEGIGAVALGSLQANPFPDSTAEFLGQLERLVGQAMRQPFLILQPYAARSKPEIIRAGCDLPLEHTFSCIHPVGDLHCGACNKCAERKQGFRDAGVADPTQYA